MASNNFLHDESGITSTISDLNTSLADYKDNVGLLKKFVAEMEDSSSWKDEDLKTSFIATANSYIDVYNNFASGIEGYISALKTKSGNIVDNENKFSK